ncbi:unnamed protein product [Onchocerca flexuosa]|uniref:Uncharacterized protein n=1 Tax=Onchocerca flexuosa TaxID=387005 RepID=A0A183H1N1_9BILA|nr:unnamed protein product [Onchocerca flexuosa]
MSVASWRSRTSSPIQSTLRLEKQHQYRFFPGCKCASSGSCAVSGPYNPPFGNFSSVFSERKKNGWVIWSANSCMPPSYHWLLITIIKATLVSNSGPVLTCCEIFDLD